MITEEEKKELVGVDEVTSYFIIDECSAFIWRMNHDMGHDRIPKENHPAIQEDINRMREIQKFVVENLKRFNVDGDSVNNKDGEYWKWYKFWDDWKKSLRDEDWATINDCISNGKPIEDLLPNKTWRD